MTSREYPCLVTLLEQELEQRGLFDPPSSAYNTVLEEVAGLLASRMVAAIRDRLAELVTERLYTPELVAAVAEAVQPALVKKLTAEQERRIADQAALVASTRILTDDTVLSDVKESIKQTNDAQLKEFGVYMDEIKRIAKLDNMLRLGRLERALAAALVHLELPEAEQFKHLALPPKKEEDDGA